MPRADRWLLAGLFLAIAAVSPWFPGIKSANELGRVYAAEALVVDGTLAIDGPIARWHDLADKAERDGRTYCEKAPGVTWLAVPAVAAYRALSPQPTLAGQVRAARLLGSLLPTALLLWGVLRWLREHVGPGTARAVVAAYGLGSLATTYGVLLFGHQAAAAGVFWAFLLARDAHPGSGRWRLVGVGAAAAGAVAAAYPAALPLIPVGALFVARVRGAPRALAWASLGAAPIVAGLMAWHTVAFGGPFVTGYAWLNNDFFRRMHAEGFMGLRLPRPGKLWFHFLSPRKGLLFFAPWLLLALPGLWALRGRRDRRVVWAVVGLLVAFMLSLKYGNGGWTLSQRHLTGLVPWLTLPVALWIDGRQGRRALFVALALVAVALTGLGTAVFPYYPVPLHNPSFQLGLPLLRSGHAADSLWQLVGVPTLWGCGVAWAFAAVGWLRPLGGRAAAAAVLGAAAWLVGIAQYAADQPVARPVGVVERALKRAEAEVIRAARHP